MSDVSSALALAAAGVPATLCRPCEDCGLITGRFCDSCFAIDRVPSEVWAAGQLTPLCSSCRNRYGKCHYCRGMTWVTAPPWTEVKEAAMRAPHGHSSSFTYSSSASSSYGIPADAKACAGLISLRVGTPPAPITQSRHSAGLRQRGPMRAWYIIFIIERRWGTH